MKCFVTGASGFIGANLVHELLARGHTVRALIRENCKRLGLSGMEIEEVPGHLRDARALDIGLKGCDWCFHVAGSYHLWLRDYRPMYDANVEGTRTVISAAARAGCRRIVYTSTVGCIGMPRVNGSGGVTIADEQTPVSCSQMGNHYKKSKWKAERLALDFAARGVPVVVVNPSAPAGSRDVRPTPTGKVILDFLRRQMPAYIDTGLNWVHVRDVAVGHILAAEKGRVGERYILGNQQGNWTLSHAFDVLEEVSGVPRPRVRLPYGVALAAAFCDEGLSLFTRRPPKAVMAGVRMARQMMFFSPAKAVRELGLPQTSPRQGFVEAVHWFREQGYVQQTVSRLRAA